MYEPTLTPLMEKLAGEHSKELKLTKKEEEKIQEAWDEYRNSLTYGVINLVYYGEPKAQPRAKARVINGNVSFHDPASSLKQFVVEQLTSQLGKDFKPIEKELYFEVRYYRAMPKSISGTRVKRVLAELGAIRPTCKPDLDNYEKLLYDAVNGVLFTDDSLIVKGNHEKFYSIKPRVEITIRYRK